MDIIPIPTLPILLFNGRVAAHAHACPVQPQDPSDHHQLRTVECTHHFMIVVQWERDVTDNLVLAISTMCSMMNAILCIIVSIIFFP